MHLPELREKIENADSISTKKGNIMHRTKVSFGFCVVALFATDHLDGICRPS